MQRLFFLIAVFFICVGISFSQRGKDGDIVITAVGTSVNTYTTLSVNATSGATSLNVANNALNGAGFSGNLAQGDLIMIVQMQGIHHWNGEANTYNIDIDYWPPIGWGGTTSAFGHNGDAYQNTHKYGRVVNYLNTGNYELREVLSVSGSNQINLTCPLENSYASFGRVQVIRVPRYNNLTVQSGASVVPTYWTGTTGGVVAVEVNGNLILNGSINASDRGFRGGNVNGVSITGNNTQHTQGAGNGDTYLGSLDVTLGGAVGESIFGFTTEYTDIHSVYGRGAIANGGGGGGPQNAGGGGGSNVGDTAGYNGKGIPTPGYNVFWNAERPNMATTFSGGGGRGGYTYATSAQNPNIGPNRSAWQGNARKENGGYGGHPLVYNPSKMFLGGGGGAGGQDSGQGGSGGAGGGIVHLTVYGNISGSGSVLANGAPGQNSNPSNQSAIAGQRRGNDGGGGGGGGGYIYIKNTNPLPGTITLNAIGGNGGTNALRIGVGGGSAELCGPGAGGAGGGIAFTSGTPVTSVNGGAPGGTTHNGSQNSMSTQFPMNGATSGGLGLTNLNAPTYDIIALNDTICGSQSTTLTASVVGTLPGGATIGWFTAPYGGTQVGTGTTFNTPILSSTTTYYVGTCPGTFRRPVTVVVGSNPVIAGTATIVDATCTVGGSISGLTASGGTGTLVYEWNGTVTPGPDLSNASAGNYTLVVTDANGCLTQSGPHVIGGTGGPTITGTPVITLATCTVQGTITGLEVNATVPITGYEWNGISSSDQNLTADAGSYTLIVTDANGCTAQSGPHTIGQAPTPSIAGTVAITNEDCNSGGSITGLTVSGGTTPYTYDWNGTVTATPDLFDASSGSYTLTVTDANGCEVQSGPYQIEEDSAPTIIETNVVLTNATCMSQGSITGLSVTGGIAPYTYEWNGITGPSINLTGASPANYTLVVTDANGCTATSSSFTITIPDAPVISGTPVISNVTCNSQGSLTGLSVTGGTAPYVYAWNMDVSPTTDLTGASAGQYTLYVTDNAGCVTQSGPYTIGEETAPVLGGVPSITDATCTQGGSITGITVSGGVQPYSYEWNGNTVSQINLNNVSAGSYTLTVTDANGCALTSGPHIIGSVGVPVISGTATIVNATCQNGGSVSGLSVSGGVAPYTYEWNGNTTAVIDATNLTPGTYTLIVEDANGCIATSVPYVVEAPDNPVIGGNPVVTNANCTQGGSITGMVVSGGAAPYVYSWNGNSYATLNITNLPAGIYTLTVTDANGCSVTGNPVTILEDVFIDAQFGYSPVPVFVNEIVYFHDESVGNIVSWSWQIDTAHLLTQHPEYVFSQDGIYNVTLIVVDANGCQDSVTVTIEVLSDLEVPNVITANGDGINDFFFLKGLIPNTKLLVVNRWGNLIYTSDNYDNTWNGSDMSGNEVTEGVYTYVITLPDGNQKHGFVHVVRTP